MERITSKFGGTSLADAAAIRGAVDIVNANPARRFVVPSAPGKRSPEDKKITDLLYVWHRLLKDDLDPAQARDIIFERFSVLTHDLGLKLDVNAQFKAIDRRAENYSTPDFLASRGEFLTGLIVAELLGAVFVDPAECIRFNYEGELLEETYTMLGERLAGDGRFVVPGFYGADPKGRIRTFSRGGSDVTGSIVARASKSDLYENWTDVSGFRMTDPRIVPHAQRIDEITYSELRELSYMGANVLHDEAIFPVRRVGVPINIRNSSEPDNPGTMILPRREATQPVRGIAARKGFSMINIEKALMNKEIGFGRRVLGILEHYKVSFEHMPTGIDTISLIVKDEVLGDHGDAIVKEIEKRCDPDRVSLTSGLALIATVGQGMNHYIGVAARLCTALAEARVNLRVIDQGSSETNIIVGVEENDMERAVLAIYNAFQNWDGPLPAPPPIERARAVARA